MRQSYRTTLFLAAWAAIAPALADDWPQWRGTDRDGRWTEKGIVEAFDTPQIPIRWRAKVGAGYTGPTIAQGRVYVMDRLAEASQERVLCFDASDGRPLWTHAYDATYRGIGYDAGPRASVTVHDGLAYALGAMGHIHCLGAADGKLEWQRDLNREYELQRDERRKSRMPMWGIAGAPLVYDNLVILHIGGRDGACVVALDRANGQEIWRALDDRAQYTAPILIQQAGQDVVVVWTGDNVVGLSPRSGQVHWRHPLRPVNMPIGVATPIVHDNQLFVTSFYDGSLMLRLMTDRLDVEEVWRERGRSENDTAALHSIISTPIWIGDYIYGVDSYGELRCLEADTGKRVWQDETATPRARWSTIHFVAHGERTWMFNERGELIIARLSPDGLHEISRAKLLTPTRGQLNQRGGVCWSHPAFANRCIYARNDEELVCASLAKD